MNIDIAGWKPGMGEVRKISLTHLIRRHCDLSLSGAKSNVDAMLAGSDISFYFPTAARAGIFAHAAAKLGAAIRTDTPKEVLVANHCFDVACKNPQCDNKVEWCVRCKTDKCPLCQHDYRPNHWTPSQQSKQTPKHHEPFRWEAVIKSEPCFGNDHRWAIQRQRDDAMFFLKPADVVKAGFRPKLGERGFLVETRKSPRDSRCHWEAREEEEKVSTYCRCPANFTGLCKWCIGRKRQETKKMRSSLPQCPKCEHPLQVKSRYHAFNHITAVHGERVEIASTQVGVEDTEYARRLHCVNCENEWNLDMTEQWRDMEKEAEIQALIKECHGHSTEGSEMELVEALGDRVEDYGHAYWARINRAGIEAQINYLIEGGMSVEDIRSHLPLNEEQGYKATWMIIGANQPMPSFDEVDTDELWHVKEEALHHITGDQRLVKVLLQVAVVATSLLEVDTK